MIYNLEKNQSTETDSEMTEILLSLLVDKNRITTINIHNMLKDERKYEHNDQRNGRFFPGYLVLKILFYWKICFKIEILDMKNKTFQRKISLDGINSSYKLQKNRSMNLEAKHRNSPK